MTGPGELGRKWLRECGWREGGRVVVYVFDVEDLTPQCLCLLSEFLVYYFWGWRRIAFLPKFQVRPTGLGRPGWKQSDC